MGLRERGFERDAAFLAHRGGTAEQVNRERDVLLVVVEGSGFLWLDGVRHEVGALHALLVEKGWRYALLAGETGIRYLSIHVRPPPLRIAPLPS